MSDGITEARKGFTKIDLNKIESKLEFGKKTYIFRIKIDKNSNIEGLICDHDGFFYIISDNPSNIYQHIPVDYVISIEKISHCYII